MALIQKSFSDIITFSRSSNATRVGPTGLVEYAPHNLVLQSQTFDNAAWVFDGGTKGSNTTAAPDGTVTADQYIENTTVNALHELYQSVSVTSGQTYTFSGYFKRNGRDLSLIAYATSALFTVNVNLATGAVISTSGSGTYTITSVGNGWYRVSATVTATATGTGYWDARPFNGSSNTYTGDGTSGIYLWGAQLSVGPYALDYTPTTSAAVYGPRFDYDGSGVTIVEPVSRNLFTYSEQFDNAAWAKASVTVSANSVVSPDGTTNADTLIPATNTADHDLYPLVTLTATSHTLSIYAKYSGYNLALSVALGGSIWAGCIFDLQNGIAKTPQGSSLSCTANIQNVGNGWYRCSITYTATSASWYQIISATNDVNATMGSYGFISFTGNGTSGLHLWGAQLEVGSTATAYMASGATNGFRAVPVVSGSSTARGLLVEESRTNLVTYSEQFDNAAWTANDVTISANAAASPDGTVTADTLTENTAASTHRVFQILTSTAAAYTASVFAKAGTRNWIYLRVRDSGNVDRHAWFNLSTSAVGTTESGITASIQALGNGWYRCIATIATASSGSGNQPFVIGMASADNTTTYTGNGTGSVSLWGAQLEAGSFATSYIPTLASTVTRSADVASVNTLSPWANLVEGTIYSEFDVIGSSGASQRIVSLDETGGNGYFVAKAGSSLYDQVYASGVAQANLSVASSSLNSTIKNAFAFKVNDFEAITNGTNPQTDTSGSLPTPTQLSLGMRFAADNQLNGHLRRIAFYPRRLSSSELQALTA